MEDISETKNKAELDTKQFDELQEQMTIVDFKMVTFSLAGKD